MTKNCRVCLFENADEAEYCQRCHSKFFKSLYEWVLSADYPKPFVFDNARSQWKITGLALVFLLLICSFGCLPGIVFGQALFPREVPRVSLVRETVVVTSTPSPTPVGPTNTPTTTGTPTPIPTETPTATPIPTTSPEMVLEPGQVWIEDGLAVRLDVAAIKPDQLLIDLSVRNIGEQPILFEIKPEMIRMVTNTGDIIGPPTNVYGQMIFGWNGGSIGLESGESFDITKGGGFQKYNLANSEITAVIVEVVGLSRIEKSQWRVEIPK